MVNNCIEQITKQQSEKKNTIYWLGEQLKDYVKAHPRSAEIIATDLEQVGMGLADLEKKIAEYANANGGCTPPQEAERIIREFYGLPTDVPKQEDLDFNLLDFL